MIFWPGVGAAEFRDVLGLLRLALGLPRLRLELFGWEDRESAQEDRGSDLRLLGLKALERKGKKRNLRKSFEMLWKGYLGHDFLGLQQPCFGSSLDES